MSSFDTILAAIRFDANGLVPAIAQQHDTGEVLMMAWMNAEAVAETLATGRVCYFSRSRGKLWRKGETSGQQQQLKDFRLDCDGDTVLLQVDQTGVACHTGRRNCFFLAARDGQLVEIAAPLVAPEELYGEQKPTASAVPLTVITGFLGAGKTTLLNHLLRQPALAGTAVLVNEFGDIGLDHLLVEKLDEDTVLLNSGCLCCSVRGDLAKALRGLLPRVQAGEVKRVVVETTGLADPAPILATLMSDVTAATKYRLDGVVTVVDAVHGAGQMDAHPEALRQVAVADRIVLSKADLVAPDALAALRERIARINPAPQIVADHGVADPAALLNAGLFDPAGKHPDVRGWLDAEAYADRPAQSDPNRHDDRIAAFCLTFAEPLHWQGIGSWLEMLVATRGDSLLRVKGILNLHGQERPVAIHGVQHLFHPPALLNAWPDGDPRTSRLVFITRDLPRDVIEEGLRAFEAAAKETA
jgi:G3E family GTPase/phosphoribosyl-AMP cyclohydrolase